jgi:hypothetical protein
MWFSLRPLWNLKVIALPMIVSGQFPKNINFDARMNYLGICDIAVVSLPFG